MTKKLLRFISFKVMGRANTKHLLTALFNAFSLNMLEVAHNEAGINNYGDLDKTGENFVLNRLVEKFKNIEKLIIFDIGANSGDYSLDLKRLFPSAVIYAFEPNPQSFRLLDSKKQSIKDFHPYCLGLGSSKSQTKIYTYKDNPETEHASIFKEVIADLHHSADVAEYQIDIIDLDSFCNDMNIEKINFVKIDTEGYELEVLKGAVKMIQKRAVDFIQFEFNEMNIISKTFLKDFYSILPGYTFYRLSQKGLIPLGEYTTVNEIFRFQNILACHKEIAI